VSAGGFYDHVVPPFEGVPSDDADCHVNEGCPDNFDFRRLGGRAPAFVISPWVPQGAVFQEPRGKAARFGNSSQFELSSIPATAKSLFNLTNWLTKRDEWAVRACFQNAFYAFKTSARARALSLSLTQQRSQS
jgi:phospholipase C